MEVKLSHSHRRAVLPFPKQASTFPSHSFSFQQHFRGLSKKWRIQLQEVVVDQNASKNLVVHVVKKAETLTSILKRYGVSVYSTAASSKNNLDVDLISEAQKLNIPSYWNEIQVAKTTGYFLVLVPLIAFCFRCIIGAFHTRIAGASVCQGVKESKGNPHGSKNVHWRSALSDIIEGDVSGSDSRPQKNVLDSNSRPDSDDPSEDQSQVSFEEFSHAYSKLERDYEKFLSECGISKWGYWRGGSPK